MPKYTDFLNLKKGEEEDYFDYETFLNANWDKVEDGITTLYKRDNEIYVNEIDYNAVGNALFKKISFDINNNEVTTWWENSTFEIPAKDNRDAITLAMNAASSKNKILKFPKGRYHVAGEFNISQINTDFIFESGSVIVGNVKMQDVKNVTFNNFTIEGNLTIDSVESCRFLNVKVTGKTSLGATLRGKNNTLNLFLNCNFNGVGKGLEFYSRESIQSPNITLQMKVINNTFMNCSIIGTNYGIYAEMADNLINAVVSNNLFMNCQVKSTVEASTAIYLGKNVSSFNFIEQAADGIKYSIDTESSLGKHNFASGSLIGEVKGIDKFLNYKPTSLNSVSTDKSGNNINNMRKMKVFNNEVPKWLRNNVTVSSETATLGLTDTDCLKIVNTVSSSFPSLERVFSPSDHLNQTINVVARVKASSAIVGSEAAIILTNTTPTDEKTITIPTDDTWRIVTAKMEITTNKNVTIKLSPNNSYENRVNNLFIDWIIISLGDIAQLSTIPAEEHHYSDLSHFGNFNIRNGDMSILKNCVTWSKVDNVITSQSSNAVLEVGARNINSVNNLATFKYKLIVESKEDDDDNNQVLKVYSVNRSTNIESLEEILQISNDGLLYKQNEILHSGNALGSGVTSNRPSNPKIGRQYFDTTLKKPVWWAGSYWVDAMGTTT